jgi:hypothetical protein
MTYAQSMLFILACVVGGVAGMFPVLRWLDRPSKPKKNPRLDRG